MTQFPLAYPLTLSFKFFGMGPRVSVTDANGQMVAWVAMKAFRIKEAVSVFSDSSRKELLYTIDADRALDFHTRYHFHDGRGKPVGSVQRLGVKSLWKAHYDILDSNADALSILDVPKVTSRIREEKPWIKVVDGLLGLIPGVELFTGLFLHPSYVVSKPDGTVLVKVNKRAAFAEGRFSVDQVSPMEEIEEKRILLGLVMMVLMERDRG
jgi:uncharacterized protein YxjI